jgi:IS30 family transposase
MKNTYNQLSGEERDKIAILCALGISQEAIAKVIGRHKSTISRELKRNRAPTYNVYLPHKAHERANRRKQEAGKRGRLKNPIIRAYVMTKLKLGWSPEQISGRLPADHPELTISPEAIYQYIYDKENRKQCDLTIYLARANKKRKRHGHSNKHQKSHIPQRVTIDKRPQYIEKRIQPGHWEADTVISRQSKKTLAVILERSSRLLHIERLSSKTSDKLSKALKRRLSHHPKHMRRTITYDNGSENVEHQKINYTLGTKSYFCNPYHSWEKGSVENAVGLIRRFLPKKTDFATVSHQQIKGIETLLNNRPRKCLDYKTPLEVFISSVALAG